jgi:hypothetical protein
VTAAQQVKRASEALDRWPFIPAVEDEHGLPRWMLLAVGLRETGLRHIVGDGGHGHGPWQYDDRTPGRAAAIARIDGGDTQFAAEIAAGMLRSLFVRYGDWVKALNVYNSGQTTTERTTGHNYGPNVMDALDLLQRSLGPLDHPTPLPPGPGPLPGPGPAPIHIVRNGRWYMQHTVNVTVDTAGNGWEPTSFAYAGAIVQSRATANPRPPEQGGNGRYHITHAAGLDTGGKLDVVVMGADPSPNDQQRYTVPILVDIPD